MEETSLPSCNFPDHVLENIFSCIPGTDMLTVCTRVCNHWNTLIKNSQFMPWKKLYLKIRNHDEESYSHVKMLLNSASKSCSPFPPGYNMFAIVSLICYMQEWKPNRLSEEDKKAMKSLHKHSLYNFATEVVTKRVAFYDEMNIKINFWILASTILCLSSTSRSLLRLHNCLLEHHYLHVVMDFFYLAAACSWVLYKEALLSQQLHYTVFSFISSIENTKLPHPGEQNIDPEIMKLTYEQLKISSYAFKKNEVIEIRGYAGTGKTMTLASCVRMNPNLRFLYTSLNKELVKHGKQFFTDLSNVDCLDFHNLAYARMNMSRYPKKLSHKPFSIADIRNKLNMHSADKQLPYLVLKTLNQFLHSSDSKITLSHVPLKQNIIKMSWLLSGPISNKRRKKILELSKDIYRRSCDLSMNDWEMTADYYLKQWQLSQPSLHMYDVILVDEFQDCTDCVKEILERQIKCCCLVLVNDSYQQTRDYSESLKTIPSTRSFYLTQSFRFGHEIAQVCDAVLRAIKYRDFLSTQDSETLNVYDKTLLGIGEPGTLKGEETECKQLAIICGKKIGLFRAVYLMLIANPKKKIAVFGGTDRFDLDLLTDLYALNKPKAKRNRKWRVKRKDLRKYQSLIKLRNEAHITGNEDMLEQIDIVLDLDELLPKVVKTLKNLPNNSEMAEVVFLTVDQAKGLEFDNVKIHDDFGTNSLNHLVPPNQLTSSEKIGENLLYIAITRAKKSLTSSGILTHYLEVMRMHFITPYPVLTELNDKQDCCVRCNSCIISNSVMILHQDKISNMQEEGFLCSKCGSLLAPGWGYMLGDFDDICPGEEQEILREKQCWATDLDFDSDDYGYDYDLDDDDDYWYEYDSGDDDYEQDAYRAFADLHDFLFGWDF